MSNLAEQTAVALQGKTPEEMRAKILALEATMLAMPAEVKVEFEVRHHFAPGVYMRELHIPKGTLLTGKIHKTEHLNILSQGQILVWTDEGMKRLTASTVVKSKPGIKRVGYAEEDSVWITVHENADNCRDTVAIEERLTAKSFEEIEYLASSRTYEDALRIHGFTHEQAWALTQRTADQVPFPDGVTGLIVDDSPIHGKGLFATRRFEKGETMGPARIDGKRTPAGRYCNHSSDPNSAFVMAEGGDVSLVALTVIEAGQEIVNDYFFNFANTRPTQDPIIGGGRL